MKIGACIHELLLENEIVIIPGFGAFISNYKPSEINPENDEIIPPSKEISFDQKIRNNDGLLVGYIAGNENISHFDALKEIEKERENILYELDKGERITIENIGILFLNDNNEIEFEASEQENLLLDSFGLEATSLKEVEPEELTEPEEKTEYEEQPEPEKNDDKPEEEKSEPSEVDIENKIYKNQIITESEPEEPELPVSEPQVAEEKKLPEYEIAEAETLQEKQEAKKKAGWLWFLLILIPIIGAGIFLYNKQNSKATTPIKITEAQPAENEVSLTDSIANDTTGIKSNAALEDELSPSDSIEEKQAQGKGQFYLVGGSFKEEENVQKFIDEFDIEGYKPFPLGKRGSFYIVAIGQFDTEREALDAQNVFIEKNPDSGTWVFEDKVK